MSDDHQALRVNLGAHALGALPADEAAAVEAHLGACPSCRAELEELRPVARALESARAAAPPPGPAREPGPDNPPADLGTRVLAAVAAARAAEDAQVRRRRWVHRAGLAATAGAAAAAVLVAGLALTDTSSGPAPAVPLETVAVEVTEPGIAADADLVDHTWGVEVKLHGSGFDAGERYRVSVLDDRGRPTPAGAFVGVGDTEMDCNLSSAVLREDALGFEVRDADGEVVVVSTFG